MISDRPGLSIIGVSTGRHSKMSKYLLLYREIQGFYVSSLRHCDVEIVKRSPFILINNLKEAVVVTEETYGKVIINMDAVLQIEEQFSVGCTGPTSYDAGIKDLREISTHPSPSQLKEKFRLLCVFQSTGWGVRRLNSG